MHFFEERPYPRFSILGISLAFSLAPSTLRAQPAEPTRSGPSPVDTSTVVTPASAASQETQGASSNTDARIQTQVATDPQPRLQSASQSPDIQNPATSEAKPPAQNADAPEGAASVPVPGYVRLEDDYLSGFQVYAGVTYPLGHSLGLAAGIYLAENYPALQIADASIPPSLSQSWWSEFDLGPSIAIGPLSLTLEAGIAFDFASKRATALNVPQLYTTVDFAKFHFESWIWTILYSPFDTPSNDYLHARNWLLYKASGAFSLGPELEFNINLREKYGKSGLVSLPVGGRVELTFGGSSIALFLGYQTDKDSRGANGQAAVGRFALIHSF